jgi:hypothetical protein
MLEQIHGKYVGSYNVFDPDSKPYARFCYAGVTSDNSKMTKLM